MSDEINNDSFKTEMIAEIKRMQMELNELKNIKRNIIEQSKKRKPARKSAAKKKAVKRKPRRR
ncbi:MAG: hypothetical protein HRU07_09730 [Nitrosopumilus sp.]|nr:hypothetical protein [Nitrosopumilus sp.]NRA06406.1 hypothetical protein [Nitrosopumilus sp.]